MLILSILLFSQITTNIIQTKAQDEPQAIPLITPQITAEMETNVSGIAKITWSPNGGFIAVEFSRGSALGSYALAVFDEQGKHLWTLDNVIDFMFLPQGDKLLLVEISGEDNYKVKLIDSGTAEVISEGPTFQTVNVDIWGPVADGKYALLSIGPEVSKELKLIDLDTLQEVQGGERQGSILYFDSANWRFSVLEIPSLNTVFSSEDLGSPYFLPPMQDPSGKLIALFYSKNDKFFLTTIDMGTGDIIWEKELTPRQYGMIPVPSLAWSPDSKKLAVLTEEKEEGSGTVYITVLLIDSETGDVLAQSPKLHDANLLSWSPDGKLVATSNIDSETMNLTIVFIDADTGNVIAQTPGYEQVRMMYGSLFNWENSHYYNNMIYSEWAPNGQLFVAVDDYYNYVIISPQEGTLLGKIPVTSLIENVNDFRATWKPSETEALIAIAYNNWSLIKNTGESRLSIVDLAKAVSGLPQQTATVAQEQETQEETEQTPPGQQQEETQSVSEESASTQEEAQPAQTSTEGEVGSAAQTQEAGAQQSSMETVTKTKEVTRTVTIGASFLPSEAMWGLAALLIIIILLLVKRRR